MLSGWHGLYEPRRLSIHLESKGCESVAQASVPTVRQPFHVCPAFRSKGIVHTTYRLAVTGDSRKS